MNEPNIALESHPFLLVTDNHADARILESIERHAKSIRYRCFLGDAMGGDNPNDTLDRLEDYDVCIAGNHDTLTLGRNDENQFAEGAVIDTRVNREEIRGDGMAILEQFVQSFSRNGFLLFHGTPDDENAFFLNENDIHPLLASQTEYQVLIGGHMHLPRLAVYNIKSGELTFEEIKMPFSHFVLDTTENRYLVNVPSAIPGRLGFNRPGYSTISPTLNPSEYNLIFTFL